MAVVHAQTRGGGQAVTTWGLLILASMVVIAAGALFAMTVEIRRGTRLRKSNLAMDALLERLKRGTPPI